MADEYIRREDVIRLTEQGQVRGFPWQFQMCIYKRLKRKCIT